MPAIYKSRSSIQIALAIHNLILPCPSYIRTHLIRSYLILPLDFLHPLQFFDLNGIWISSSSLIYSFSTFEMLWKGKKCECFFFLFEVAATFQ